jgi:hypothetical protein
MSKQKQPQPGPDNNQAGEPEELAPLRASQDEDGYEFEHKPVQMDALQPRAKPASLPNTEALLNGLIAECGALLRDVAFRSACLTSDANDRIRFLTSAENLALTGAKIADSVTRLRAGGAPPVETHRHEMVFTHVQATPSPLEDM